MFGGRLQLVFLWLCVSFTLLADPKDKPKLWKPDLSTDAGVYRFLRELVSLYPNLGTEKFGYQVDVAKLYKEIPNLLQKLGKNATPMEVKDALRLTLEYRLDGEEWDSGPVKERVAKEGLESTINELPVELNSLQEDFRKFGKDNAAAFLALVPLLYNPDGSPKEKRLNTANRSKLLKKTAALGATEIVQEYLPGFEPFIEPLAQLYAEGSKKAEQGGDYYTKLIKDRVESLPLANAFRDVIEREKILAELDKLPFKDKLLPLGDELKRMGPGKESKLQPLIPFLYNSDGSPKHETVSDEVKRKIQEEFRGMDRRQLSQDYLQKMNQEYIDTIVDAYEKTGWQGGKRGRELWRKTLLERINSSALAQSLRPVNADGETVKKGFISVEQVHPLAAATRSYWVRDCCAQTAPFYPVGEGVKAYAVRLQNNSNALPNAYFVTREYNGKKGLYALGGMGFDLSTEQFNYVVRMLAEAQKAEEIAAPDIERGDHPNPAKIWDALVFDGQEAAKVEFPEYWATIDEHTKNNSQFNHELYIAKDVVEYAKVAPTPERPESWGPLRVEHFDWTTPELHNNPNERFAAAALAADVLDKMDYAFGVSKRIADAFQITPEEIQALEKVKESLKQRSVPHHETVKEVKAAFGTIAPLRRILDPNMFLEVLNTAHRESPSLAEPKEWEQLFKGAQETVKKDLETYQQNGNQKPKNRHVPNNIGYDTHVAELLLGVPSRYSSIQLIANEEMRAKATSANILTRAGVFDQLKRELFERSYGRARDGRQLPGYWLRPEGLNPFFFESVRDVDDFLLRRLGLTSEQKQAAQEYEQMRSDSEAVSLERVDEILKLLEIDKTKFLEGLNPEVAIDYYSRVYDESPETHTDREWRRIFTLLQKNVRRQYRKEVESGERDVPFGSALFSIPHEFSLINYEKVIGPNDTQYFDMLLSHLREKTNWNKRTWRGAVSLLKNPHLTLEERRATAELLRERPWGPEMQNYVAELLRTLPGEQNIQRFKDYYQRSPEKTVIDALTTQTNWTRPVWEALVDSLPKVTEPVMKKRYVELATQFRAWPKEFRERLVQHFQESQIPAGMRSRIQACMDSHVYVGIAEELVCQKPVSRVGRFKDGQ